MKHWPQFLLCLLLSASIWLIHNLSQTYAGVVSVSVLAQRTLKGRAAVSRSPETVSARCSATGFKLMQLQHLRHDVRLAVHAEDLTRTGEDNYYIPAAEMAKYTSDIFGDGVTLITFLNQGYTFEFAPENCKTVPVRPVLYASYKSQYMAAGPIKLSPDSVTVYGEDSKLAAVDEVLTRTLNFTDMSKSRSGEVKLVQPPGLRISDSAVAWSLEVTRYIEQRSEVRIGVRNVPSGVEFSVYPSVAQAVFRCQFPYSGDPAADAVFFIDYADFASSVSGRCAAHTGNLPPYVISCTLEPEVFDCMVTEDLR